MPFETSYCSCLASQSELHLKYVRQERFGPELDRLVRVKPLPTVRSILMLIVILARQAFLEETYLKHVLRKRLGPELDCLVPPVPDGQPVVRVAAHRGQLTPVVTEDRAPKRALRAATKDLKERKNPAYSGGLESAKSDLASQAGCV